MTVTRASGGRHCSSFSALSLLCLLGVLGSLSLASGSCIFRAFVTDPATVYFETNTLTPNFSVSDTCPELEGGDLCCNKAQYDTITNQMMISHIVFGACEACFRNLRQLWCDFACSPNQAEFVRATETHFDKTYNKTLVDSTELSISHEFVSGMWDSCKDEVVGAYPLDENWATPEVFLQYQANMNTGKPKITFDFQPDTSVQSKAQDQVYYNGTIIPCKEMCNCSNCGAACHVPIKPIPSIGHMPVSSFILLVGVVGALALLVVAVGVRKYKLLRTEELYNESSMNGSPYQPSYSSDCDPLLK